MNGRALLYCAGGGIGDSLIASVVGRALRARYESVDALTLPGHAGTLRRVPDLDDVLIDDTERPQAELAEELRVRAYRACVVTWATPRTARIPQLAKIPLRAGQARRLYSHRFNRRVVVRSEAGDVLSHWSDVLLDYARAIDCDTSDRIPAFVPTERDEREAAAVLAKTGLTPRAFIIMHPTNAVAPKRGNWPVEGWSALARGLHERYGVAVAVSGAEADLAIIDAVVRGAGSGVTSIAGTTGIGGFGAIARSARAFVGITTGSMHVAAAVGAPTTGIFPFQSDFPDRWAPLGARTNVVRPSFPCHPGDRKETCADYACVANLNVRQILAAVEALAP